MTLETELQQIANSKGPSADSEGRRPRGQQLKTGVDPSAQPGTGLTDRNGARGAAFRSRRTTDADARTEWCGRSACVERHRQIKAD